jgi:hypothetical protein
MVLLGYEPGSKAYRMFDPRAEKVVVSRDVVFDEASSWKWEEKEEGGAAAAGSFGTFTVEYSAYDGGEAPEHQEGSTDPRPGTISVPLEGHPLEGSADSRPGTISVPLEGHPLEGSADSRPRRISVPLEGHPLEGSTDPRPGTISVPLEGHSLDGSADPRPGPISVPLEGSPIEGVSHEGSSLEGSANPRPRRISDPHEGSANLRTRPGSANPRPRPGFVSPPPDISEHVDNDYGGEPLRFRRVDDIIDDSTPPGLAERELDLELHLCTRELNDQELHLGSAEEPPNFTAAQQEECWRVAMREEMASVEENHTWELVDPPIGCRPIGLKWVFKVKRNERGEIVRHKARLVAKGFVQREGIDFQEVFAPVARMESVRLLLALAASKDWRVHHMDVKSAFLNGELEEEIYVQQPPGFEVAGEERKVLRLRKALYGLRQAPRAWNTKLDTSLGTLGFTKCATEHALYTKASARGHLIVGVYVDDLIITGAAQRDIDDFKRQMTVLFRMSDLGLLTYYLGIEVQQGRGANTLRQSDYARKLLERGGMSGCKPCPTPMEEKLKLSKASSAPRVDATSYRSIVGGLRYLEHTRPDISFAVGYVSRFMEDPREDHLAAVKHLLRYVAGTVGYGLIYPRGGAKMLKLLGYSDSDMAGDLDGRRSTTGVIFFLGACPVTWQSHKQKVVALSTCEAEYIAAATASCQGVWLRRLLHELTGEEAPAPVLRVDNQSAIALAKNPVLHDRSKHIEIKYHYIRECVDGGRIILEHVVTGQQLGDIFTKPLGRLRFLEMRTKIGVEELEHPN